MWTTYILFFFCRLVKSEDMIKVLSTSLPQAKSKLSHHGLLEVRAGAQTLAAPPSEDESTSGSGGGGLGSLEIAVLGMACAVFLGALIAVVSIFCLRIRRSAAAAKGGRGYPAPLAIPLPSYSMGGGEQIQQQV